VKVDEPEETGTDESGAEVAPEETGTDEPGAGEAEADGTGVP